MVFIVGMERCYTTSLAQWLIDTGLCDWFVDDVKEPAMFSSEPARALARWERERHRTDRWLLDGSVCYVWDDAALAAIARVPEHRVILCFRNQAWRMVSAYRLFRALFGIDSGEILSHPVASQKFGSADGRAKMVADPLAPVYLRQPVPFGHFNTLLRYSEVGPERFDAEQRDACDREFERFEKQNLPIRVVYEWARWKRDRRLPLPSVLANSYFANALRKTLAILGPSRLMIATLSNEGCRKRMKTDLPAFLGREPVQASLGHHLQSEGLGFDVPQRDIERAIELVREVFDADTCELLDLAESIPAAHRTLFDESELFRVG